MKPLTLPEIVRIALDLQTLVGAQVQECLQTESELGLAFYHDHATFWLWFDLNPLRPLVVRMGTKPPPRKKITRPLSLFLKARFLGRRLESVRADVARGRILVLTFHRASDEETREAPELEVRLFPHGQNVLARDGKTVVAEQKPKELPPSVTVPAASPAPPIEGGIIQEAGRSWEEIEAEWRAEQAGKAKGVQASARDAAALERDWKKAIEKKEKALERMREELAKKTSGEHRALGEWLKAHATLDVPEQWRALIDREQGLAFNIEAAFHRAKENERKVEGARERLHALESEIAELRARGPGGHTKRVDQERKEAGDNLLARAEARGRRMKIGTDLEVYIGKSAADNLALLRRAQPFDYWLHLRDQPGSHAILRRARGRLVTEAELAEAGKWVVEQSLGRRASELQGERHDLLIVECRYVRPIKGDRLGRVNYTHDRVLTLRF